MKLTATLLTFASVAFAVPTTRTTKRQILFDEKVVDYSDHPGIYQSDYSYKTQELFVTASTFDPVYKSKLYKVNPNSLLVTDSADGKVLNKTSGAQETFFGIALDDKRGHIWLSNSMESTISVWGKDLKLIHQYDQNLLEHARDLAVDEDTGNVYMSSSVGDAIGVFNADKTDGPVKILNLTEATGEKLKWVMALTFDKDTGMLYTVTYQTSYAVAVDTRNDYKTTLFDLHNKTAGGSGVGYDFYRSHLFIASQNSNNTVVLDTKTGKILADLPTGAGGINAKYDPHFDVVYVNLFDLQGDYYSPGAVAVIDAKTLEIITKHNLDGRPDHLNLVGNDIFLTLKAQGEQYDDYAHDSLVKLTAREA